MYLLRMLLLFFSVNLQLVGLVFQFYQIPCYFTLRTLFSVYILLDSRVIQGCCIFWCSSLYLEVLLMNVCKTYLSYYM